MTDIDVPSLEVYKKLKEQGYSQEGAEYYYDNDGEIIHKHEGANDAPFFLTYLTAIPTVEGLIEFLQIEKGIEHIKVSSVLYISDKKEKVLFYQAYAIHDLKSTYSDNFPDAIDALIDLCRKMGVIE